MSGFIKWYFLVLAPGFLSAGVTNIIMGFRGSVECGGTYSHDAVTLIVSAGVAHIITAAIFSVIGILIWALFRLHERQEARK